MQIRCPRCGRTPDPADIDLASNRALCRPCGELFPLPDTASPAARAPSTDVEHRPSDLSYTESFEPGRARIKLTPSRLIALPMLLLSLFFVGMAVAAFAGLLHSSHGQAAPSFIVVPQLGIGLFVLWLSLSRLLNTVTISIEGGRFVVRQGPVPARGIDIPISEIDGFDVVESRKSQGKTSWNVRALTKEGKARKLPLLIDAPEHVKYVAARLTAALANARETTGYRDEAWRFRAPAAVETVEEPVEEAPVSESRTGTRAR